MEHPLQPEDQEYDETDDYDINNHPDECAIEAQQWSMTEFAEKEELVIEVERLKNVIYNLFFQKGDAHNPDVLHTYVNFLGLLYNVVAKSLEAHIPPNLDFYNANQDAEVRDALAHFFQYLKKYYSLSYEMNEMVLQLLKLHLVCFPYCQRQECLTME
jgi:hypothetical protein